MTPIQQREKQNRPANEDQLRGILKLGPDDAAEWNKQFYNWPMWQTAVKLGYVEVIDE